MHITDVTFPFSFERSIPANLNRLLVLREGLIYEESAQWSSAV